MLIKTLFLGKTKSEILKELEKKYLAMDEFDNLIQMYNETLSIDEQHKRIVKNFEHELNKLVPEDIRITTALHSVNKEVFTFADFYAVYREGLIFSFSSFENDYCPISLEPLAEKIFNTLKCLHTKNKIENKKSYEEMCADRYEYL